MQHAIEIEGLRKAYGDVEAVRGLTFSVAAGEVFCLLGPNGAGKTTTTEILEGYRARSAGEVRVLGHDPELGERALRERVGIVLQEAAAQAELTVAEVLTMYGRYYPRTRAVSELVGLVGLAPGMGDDQGPLRAGQDRVPHHALHGRGAVPGRPRRGHGRRAARRAGHAGGDRRDRPGPPRGRPSPPRR